MSHGERCCERCQKKNKGYSKEYPLFLCSHPDFEPRTNDLNIIIILTAKIKNTTTTAYDSLVNARKITARAFNTTEIPDRIFFIFSAFVFNNNNLVIPITQREIIVIQ